MRLFVFVVAMVVLRPVYSLEAPAALSFDVVRYEVTGANPLPAEVIAKVLKPYLGRHHGLDGLSSAVDEMERVLKNLGYSFHRVILEPQSLQKGVVKLRVLEFKLGRLKVIGQKYFSEENIKNSLPSLIEGRTPNTRLLNRSLAIANDHPDKIMQMVFKEGESENTIDVDLKVLDKSPHTSYAKLANTGTDQTGDFRLGLGYQYSNLFDKDHIASINFSTSLEQPEDVSQWVLSYSLPFYWSGDQLAFYFSDSEINTTSTISGVSGNFNVNGTGQVLGARYMQGFKKRKGYKQKIFYGFDYKQFNNQILFNNTPTAGTNKLKSAPVSIEYEISRPKGPSPFNAAISLYLNLIDDQDAYDLETREPDTKWSLIRLRMNYDLPVASYMMRLKMEGQFVSDPLISSEQFGVGGSESVRAYEERAILGDRGYGLNIELWNTATNKKFRWLAFYDVAQTTFIEDTGTGVLKENPSSIGAGVRWLWKKNISLSADLALAQEDAGETESGDVKLHFNMIYQY